mgnify:CR=1 FL=1
MRALFSLLVIIIALTACTQKSDRRELRVSVLETHPGASPKDYDGGVRYHLAVVCEGEPDKILTENQLGSSQLTLPWRSELECKDGVTRLQYAILVNWMRCDSAGGTEQIDVRSPQITIAVTCDP